MYYSGHAFEPIIAPIVDFIGGRIGAYFKRESTFTDDVIRKEKIKTSDLWFAFLMSFIWLIIVVGLAYGFVRLFCNRVFTSLPFEDVIATLGLGILLIIFGVIALLSCAAVLVDLFRIYVLRYESTLCHQYYVTKPTNSVISV